MMKRLLMMTVLALYGSPAAIAQPAGILAAGTGIIGDCQPPSASEFLLFATARTLDAQAMLRSKAPTDATTTVCRYQGEVVMRVAGFASEPSAAAWGQYLIRATGIPTTIVRPVPEALAPVVTPVMIGATTDVAPKAGSAGNGSVGKRFSPGVYKPQALSSGYAVLVNYNNRPDVAVQLGQVLNQDVGVAVYGERPYLFVMQTGEMTAANAVVKLLNDRGFLALRVEAKSVVVLRPVVKQ
ncbi:MAG: hypothetical protein LH631_07350 [Alkalinema sp. CAN_BIN05]|nr:hypothetical protein [Alkalinema sp. CAN_BIN05]